MTNYCIIVDSPTYIYVLEPFFRRKQIIVPALFIGNKVAVYIRRKPVLNLLMLMMKDEIDGNPKVIDAFTHKHIVDRPYRIKRPIK
ncbi:hypothetical protein [Pedobacter aquatilis]|uniref:hypothetical protein n=1 Tax=Pedobacter aquatilis TaxID=351343 RepID=UPI00293167E7|nr:hypothetical protein [Pedobacter aquatilis]